MYIRQVLATCLCAAATSHAVVEEPSVGQDTTCEQDRLVHDEPVSLLHQGHQLHVRSRDAQTRKDGGASRPGIHTLTPLKLGNSDIEVQDGFVIVEPEEEEEESEPEKPPQYPVGESEVICKDTPGYNQTCLFKNAYMFPNINDQVVLLVLENTSLPDMRLATWGGPIYTTPVDVRRFGNMQELREEAAKLMPKRKPGLSLLFTALYHGNWAHAMFDGLWPAYVGLAKFGKHMERFRPVVAYLPELPWAADCKKAEVQAQHLDCSMEEALRLFGSIGDGDGDMIRRRFPQVNDTWVHFDELVVGSGHAGEYVSTTSLPGTQSFARYSPSIEEDVLLAFRERLYNAHGIEPPPRRSRSNEGRDPNQPLQVLITDNERHLPSLVTDLQELGSEFNSKDSNSRLAKKGVSLASVSELLSDLRDWSGPQTFHRSNLSVAYVKWEDLQPWGIQLHVLRQTDILVSGIGTALFYHLLLPDGAATINLGWNRPRVAWGGPPDEDLAPRSGPPGLPSYGEEFLGMSNRRARMLFLPLDQLNRGPTKPELRQVLLQAEAEVRDGFQIPVARPEDNLSIFGQIILDLQRQSESSARGLAGLHPKGVPRGNPRLSVELPKDLKPGLHTIQINVPHALDQGSEDEAVAPIDEVGCHTRATGQSSVSDLVFEQTMLQNVTKMCNLDVPLLHRLKFQHGLHLLLTPTDSCECVLCEACGLADSEHQVSANISDDGYINISVIETNATIKSSHNETANFKDKLSKEVIRRANRTVQLLQLLRDDEPISADSHTS